MSKNSFLIFLALLIFPIFLFSQNKNCEEVIKTKIKLKSLEHKSEDNFRKAQYFYTTKNWDSTLVYSMKQLSATKKTDLTDYCHLLRGLSFRQLKLFKEADKEFLLISKKFVFYNYIDNYLACNYIDLKEFKKAILHFQKVLEPSTENNDCYIYSVYGNLGICYLHLNQFDKAEYYLLKNSEILKNSKDTLPLINSYFNIASLYYEQYKDAQAIPYFENAYKLSKQVKDLDTKRVAAKNMAVVEENRGNFKVALTYRKESEQWKDSLNNQSKVWAVADFEKKFAVAQKQKEIKVLQVENKLKNTQRNGFFFTAIGLLLLLTGGVYVYAQKVKSSKIILLQKNKLDELNATKDQLFSIVSHDLRSSVNALKTSNAKLSSTLETKNYEELNQLIVQNSGIANSAYSLLDNLLHWAMLQTKQLYFQKESVHLYSIVQQIEYNYKPLLLDKGISFENSVSKNIFIFVDLDSVKIVLRNLLDNAIKFSNENGKISIYSENDTNASCQLIIQDDGIGMKPETIEALLSDSELLSKKSNSETIGTGLGLQLCKQMVRKNDGQLAIESNLNKGTKMILTFPKTANNG
ncbi:tetratricopeptide repeat-containing sensor histidine kinase [Flavobacterium anhuiense]|uniref:tetratricopeptide repeat-containing sensor histidine kinase n=2 Tax=Flavobacteriaceae TaxID=49546 RepID=UPI0011822398|nr:tetratricopeptide repeat-containing sensor histidine kinase [Flavobacterium anhuiense]